MSSAGFTTSKPSGMIAADRARAIGKIVLAFVIAAAVFLIAYKVGRAGRPNPVSTAPQPASLTFAGSTGSVPAKLSEAPQIVLGVERAVASNPVKHRHAASKSSQHRSSGSATHSTQSTPAVTRTAAPVTETPASTPVEEAPATQQDTTPTPVVETHTPVVETQHSSPPATAPSHSSGGSTGESFDTSG